MIWKRSLPALQIARIHRKNSGRSRTKTGETETKWDQYETAVNEMIQKTSTVYAPWHILESTDKKYARIKALTRIVVEELEKVLGCS